MKSLYPSDIIANSITMPDGRFPQLRTVVPQIGGSNPFIGNIRIRGQRGGKINPTIYYGKKRMQVGGIMTSRMRYMV